MRRKIWTQEMIDVLVEMFPDNCISDIADRLGCSTTAVRSKAIELGLKKAEGYNRYKYCYRYVGRRTSFKG